MWPTEEERFGSGCNSMQSATSFQIKGSRDQYIICHHCTFSGGTHGGLITSKPQRLTNDQLDKSQYLNETRQVNSMMDPKVSLILCEWVQQEALEQKRRRENECMHTHSKFDPVRLLGQSTSGMEPPKRFKRRLSSRALSQGHLEPYQPSDQRTVQQDWNENKS